MKVDFLKQQNFYGRLGVERGASLEEIASAYQELCRLYSPKSTFRTSVLQAPVSDIECRGFELMTEAFDTLSDKAKKSLYDQNLAAELGDADEIDTEYLREHQQSYETSAVETLVLKNGLNGYEASTAETVVLKNGLNGAAPDLEVYMLGDEIANAPAEKERVQAALSVETPKEGANDDRVNSLTEVKRADLLGATAKAAANGACSTVFLPEIVPQYKTYSKVSTQGPVIKTQIARREDFFKEARPALSDSPRRAGLRIGYRTGPLAALMPNHRGPVDWLLMFVAFGLPTISALFALGYFMQRWVY